MCVRFSLRGQHISRSYAASSLCTELFSANNQYFYFELQLCNPLPEKTAKGFNLLNNALSPAFLKLAIHIPDVNLMVG
jgi:hypothetical protein